MRPVVPACYGCDHPKDSHVVPIVRGGDLLDYACREAQGEGYMCGCTGYYTDGTYV
jgi:hypothetical protein